MHDNDGIDRFYCFSSTILCQINLQQRHHDTRKKKELESGKIPIKRENKLKNT